MLIFEDFLPVREPLLAIFSEMHAVSLAKNTQTGYEFFNSMKKTEINWVAVLRFCIRVIAS